MLKLNNIITDNKIVPYQINKIVPYLIHVNEIVPYQRDLEEQSGMGLFVCFLQHLISDKGLFVCFL